jgi:hypothetical protein
MKVSPCTLSQLLTEAEASTPSVTKMKIKARYEENLKEVRAQCKYVRRYKNVGVNTCTIKFWTVYENLDAAFNKAQELFPEAQVFTGCSGLGSHGYDSLIIMFDKADILEKV